MRSGAELRQRWLDQLPSMIIRTGMYTTDGRAFAIQARGLLNDLCFLDEREADRDAVDEVIRGYGTLGVIGPFIALFGKEGGYLAEVASVFAEQFHRLGYLPVDRLLDSDTWDRLMAGLRERFDGRDVRRSEVIAEFGPPSIVADTRVTSWHRGVRCVPGTQATAGRGPFSRRVGVTVALSIHDTPGVRSPYLGDWLTSFGEQLT